jgi:5-methylcytosine-specific restriction endonuclease McrA
MQNKALFLNGVYENVLKQIVASQPTHPGEVFFLQPYKSHRIKVFAESPPSPKEPVRVYISTTNDLKHVHYVAEIVHWEDKRTIPPDRLRLLNKRIRKLQPKEKEIYRTAAGRECTNLLSIRNLRRLAKPFSVAHLTKTADGQRLSSNRSRSGGWSYVLEISLSDHLHPGEASALIDKDTFDKDFEAKVAESQSITSQARQKRLAMASKTPERVSVISTAFRRNPDVVAEVLARANGRCEECKLSAPFLRAKDNTPYLEIHHKVTLANGGEDTVENALALCPNCHRKLHFG